MANVLQPPSTGIYHYYQYQEHELCLYRLYISISLLRPQLLHLSRQVVNDHSTCYYGFNKKEVNWQIIRITQFRMPLFQSYNLHDITMFFLCIVHASWLHFDEYESIWMANSWLNMNLLHRVEYQTWKFKFYGTHSCETRIEQMTTQR